MVKSRPLLGIELHPTEIRVVELRGRDGSAQVAAFTPPPGYLSEWGILEPERIGHELRSALAKAGISASDAAFGIPAGCCTLRALSVPPVEANELHFIVQGEIEAMQLFREQGASFDLVRLEDGHLLESSGRNVLLIGAELRVLESVRETAQAAGLRVAAIEPSHSAMYRLAYVQASPVPNLFITLSETHAQLSLLDEGRIALHRSFDLGGSIFEPTLVEGKSNGFPFDAEAASTVAVELRRSIDFISRELPDSPPTEFVSLVCAHEGAELLAQWLESALRVQVRVTRPGVGDDSLKFVTATGLAMRERPLVPMAAPIVDLFAHEHIRLGVQEDGRRKYRLCLLAASAFLGCSVIAATLGTLRAGQAANALAKSQKKLAETQAIERMKAEEVAHRAERLRLLSAEGVPVPATLQSIVRTLPKDVGLVEVKLTPTNTDVSGETLTEASIIQMSDALRRDGRFNSVSLTWFERVNANIPAAGMRFRMSMLTTPPVVAPSPAPAATASLNYRTTEEHS